MENNKVLIVLGPTATGKTSLSIKLAKDLNGQIINADAFQVYKELNIGVNKPTQKELNNTHFHLLNIVSIFDDWDVAKFQKMAHNKIQEIIKQKSLPILSGGSNLYIDSILYNYDFSDNLKRCDQMYEKLTNEELFEKIKQIDEDLAIKIGINNRKRLLRCFQKISNNITNFSKKKNQLYDFLIIIICPQRDFIYQNINNRTTKMLMNGWIKEVEELIKEFGYKKLSNSNAFKAIGYQIIANNLINKEPINEKLISQKTRNYAKRQITWIKHHYQNYYLYDDNYEKLIFEIKKWLEQKN